MANNYLQFSFAIERVTDEEATWTRDYLGLAEKITREDTDVPELTADQKRDRFYAGLEDHGLGFEWELDNAGAGGLSIWIHADEGGVPDMAASRTSSESGGLTISSPLPMPRHAARWPSTSSAGARSWSTPSGLQA